MWSILLHYFLVSLPVSGIERREVRRQKIVAYPSKNTLEFPFQCEKGNRCEQNENKQLACGRPRHKIAWQGQGLGFFGGVRVFKAIFGTSPWHSSRWKSVTLENVLPTLLVVQKKLWGMTHLKCTDADNIRVSVLANIKTRFQFIDLENYLSFPYVLATVSHPKFKLNWVEDSEDAKKVKRNFNDECRKFYKKRRNNKAVKLRAVWMRKNFTKNPETCQANQVNQ